jgi:hypothetical protein
MLKRVTIAAIALAAAWGFLAAAGAEEAAADSVEAGQLELTSRTLLPIFFYTPETRFGAGLAAGYFFKGAPEHRPSNVSGIAIVTTESQASLAISSEYYSPDEAGHFKVEAGVQKFPYSFWGVGNSTADSLEETYTPRGVEFSMLAEKRVLSRLTFGGLYRFWYENVSEVQAGGMLDSGEIPGSRGGHLSGLGISSTWDTRDNIYYTRKGLYARLEATYYGPGLGSSYEYGILDADLRCFTPLFNGYSLGLRSVLRSTAGHTPFQMMPGIGGSTFLRGYPGRRYIDRTAFTADVEIRTAYFWRFSFVAFGSTGHVADRVSDLSGERMRFTGGAGLRFRLNDENFNLRMDFGIGEGASGFYFIAGEAF